MNASPVQSRLRPMLSMGLALGLASLLAACGGGSGHPHPPVPPTPPHGTMYDVIPLNPRGETHGDISPRGINADGKVAGHNFSDDSRAFLYDGTRLFETGTFGGTSSQANAINRCGHVVGWATTREGISHASIYDGTLRDLGSLGGDSVGYAINNCGTAVGWSAGPGGLIHGFVYDGTMRDIGTFGGNTYPLSINAHGLVAGYSYLGAGPDLHAFIHDSKGPAGLQDLGTLGGSRSLGKVINDAGQVAGWSLNRDEVMHAFRYSDGVMRDLGTLSGSGSSEAMDMNQAGLVVGNSTDEHGVQHGFIHDGTTMRDLGTLGHPYSDAVAINNHGLVVGSSMPATNPTQTAISWTDAEGMVDLNTRLHAPPHGIYIIRALAVSDNGSIAALSNQGLVLLKLRRH